MTTPGVQKIMVGYKSIRKFICES